jgi:hypothetical protein
VFEHGSSLVRFRAEGDRAILQTVTDYCREPLQDDGDPTKLRVTGIYLGQAVVGIITVLAISREWHSHDPSQPVGNKRRRGVARDEVPPVTPGVYARYWKAPTRLQ